MAPGTSARASELPSGDLIPEIVIEYCHNNELKWRTNLVDVEDDLESRLLGAQRSELPFSLTVPGKGLVEGVLWCACRPLADRTNHLNIENVDPNNECTFCGAFHVNCGLLRMVSYRPTIKSESVAVLIVLAL